MSNPNTSKIIQELKRLYPDTRCFLHYKTPFQLLCAVILSAQCTDKRVNIVAPGLFKVFPTPEKLVKAKQKVSSPRGFITINPKICWEPPKLY
jgi:endonuclease III